MAFAFSVMVHFLEPFLRHYCWMAELCDQTENNEHLRDTFYLASIAW